MIAMALLAAAGIELAMTSFAVSAQQVARQLDLSKPRDDREFVLGQNTRKLSVTLKLDRDEYLPGEVAQLTITIRNPTAENLEVFEPFIPGTGSIWLEQKTSDDPGKKPMPYMGPMCCYIQGRSENLPTRRISSGASIVRTFQSYDSQFGLSGELFSIPTHASGEFQLEYAYGGGPVKFRVLRVAVGVSSQVTFEKRRDYFDGQKMRSSARTVGLAVVIAGGKHYIVASRQVNGDNSIMRDLTGRAVVGPEALRPFERIYTSDIPIREVRGVANEREEVQVSFVTADGRTGTVEIDSDRKVKKK